MCADALKCIAIDLFCDGELNCPDGSDEDNQTCGKWSTSLPHCVHTHTHTHTHSHTHTHTHTPQVPEITRDWDIP